MEDILKLKLHPEDLAQALGKHPVALRRVLAKDYVHNKKLDMPYGLSETTSAFRAYLGGIVASMTEKGMSREVIGQTTGLNKQESHRAERRPYAHDWKLSQIERVLKWKENSVE